MTVGKSGAGTWGRAAFHLDEIYLRGVWFGCHRSISVLSDRLSLDRQRADGRLFSGVMVLAVRYDLKSDCLVPDDDEKEKTCRLVHVIR